MSRFLVRSSQETTLIKEIKEGCFPPVWENSNRFTCALKLPVPLLLPRLGQPLSAPKECTSSFCLLCSTFLPIGRPHCPGGCVWTLLLTESPHCPWLPTSMAAQLQVLLLTHKGCPFSTSHWDAPRYGSLPEAFQLWDTVKPVMGAWWCAGAPTLFSDLMLAAWNHPWWVYLYHRNL